jgi:hypothetical protein
MTYEDSKRRIRRLEVVADTPGFEHKLRRRHVSCFADLTCKEIGELKDQVLQRLAFNPNLRAIIEGDVREVTPVPPSSDTLDRPSRRAAGLVRADGAGEVGPMTPPPF